MVRRVLPFFLFVLIGAPFEGNATEGTVALKTRAQYYDFNYSESRNFREAPYNLEFQYRSKMYGDWLGLDFHAYTTGLAKGLSSKDDERGYVGKNLESDGETLSNIGVFYLKTQFDLGDGKLRMGAGKNRRFYKLYGEDPIRVVNSASRAIDLDYQIGGSHYYGMVMDKFQGYSSGDYLNYMYGHDDTKISLLALLGSKGKFKELDYQFEYSNALDFLQRSYFSLGYDIPSMSSTVQLTGVNVFGAGDKFTLENVDSGYVAITTRTELSATTKLKMSAYQVYGGDMYQFNGQIGSTARVMSHHTILAGDVPLFEDERAYFVNLHQDFSHVFWPGLSGYIQGMWSENAKGFDDYNRWEVVSQVSQDFSQWVPALKGLKLSYWIQYHRVNGQDNGYRDDKVSNLYLFEDMTFNKFTLDYTIHF
ncbi:hypothetical protein [Ferrimonas pelagia]|uniref:Outer membrane porin, OprD family n=1 Tax=Ferrimonas pelagia TaxID=1177826 RepID=A0ABP9F3K8_9GAMM